MLKLEAPGTGPFGGRFPCVRAFSFVGPDTWETASGVERLEWLVQATGGKVYRKGKPLPAFEPRTLDIIDIAALAARVKAAGPVRFLVTPLWPGDAYGVLGAEKKAGKTWADLDLAVSVALGLKWFGRYDVERQGAVVVFAGEGGDRNIVRRIEAIRDALKELKARGPSAERARRPRYGWFLVADAARLPDVAGVVATRCPSGPRGWGPWWW